MIGRITTSVGVQRKRVGVSRGWEGCDYKK